MQSFIRGQRAKISQLSNRTRRFEVILTFCCGSIPIFDFVCFGTGAQNHLQDDRYMIFFNQRASPEGALKLEALRDQDARFAIDLDALPPHIERLHFTASSEGTGRMNELAASSVMLREAGVSGAEDVASYRFSGHNFGAEGSLLLAEIYRKDGEWRFTAVGQGFAGNLAALLKHFGGEEIEENPPTTSPTVSPTPSVLPAPSLTPPPPSPPLGVSVSTSPSTRLSPSASKPQNALQKLIDATPSGGTLQLTRGEFEGPILIDKPLLLEGAGAAIWAHNGPVVRVSSAGVSLVDLGVEATDPDEAPESQIALYVDEGTRVTLQKVRVRGEVAGVAAAAGVWKLPPALELGEFAARENSGFEFEIEVPCECELQCAVAGVSLVPARVAAGRARVQLGASGIGSDTFLAGAVEVWGGGIGRAIPLHGRAVQGAAVARSRELWRVDNAPNPA